MDATLGSALLALIQQNEVRKNIEAEAQRKFLAKEQSAKAMNRADNEWR